MLGLSSEVRQVQNAALGAYLQWRFACAYMSTRPDAAGCPLHLLLLTVPMLFHADTLGIIDATQLKSGLRTFAAKFGDTKHKQSDLLFAVHDRMKQMLQLSLQSTQIAIGAKLLTMDIDTSVIFPLSVTDVSTLSASIRKLGKCAEKLGAWCAALTLHEVCEILKVRF